MASNSDSDRYWGSRRTYLMVLLCQLIGLSTFTGVGNTAIIYGATGYNIAFITNIILFGIPVLYMEFIISQFTARDCIDVWKIYPCVSYFGYIQLCWQLFIISYNQVMNSFILHYLLISFEKPIPYYTCGLWANKDCNILGHNYTINEDCIRMTQPPKYCDALHTTFPEYQYWRYHMLGQDKKYFHIAWRVCLASGLICVITHLSCFKRKKSVQWIVQVLILFPIVGFLILLMGSMSQTGVVEMYEDTLDVDFDLFMLNFRLTHLISQVINCLGIGTGVTFNLASSCPFRAPCYSNTVITVAVSTAVTVLVICTTAMMPCPYAYAYHITPDLIILTPMSLAYEKTPRYLSQYSQKQLWLVLIYSCQVGLGIGTNLIYILHLLEMVSARSSTIAKYPGLTSFFGVIVIFICSIPLLGGVGMTSLLQLRQYFNIVGVFIVVIETVVFVIWYGLDKFSEDVHFMQGLPPNKFTRISWLVSCVVMTYTFVNEIRIKLTDAEHSRNYSMGWYALLLTISLSVIVFILRLSIAACKGRFYDEFKLDSTWGPRSELLQRSRAMFTAQAMTKEYLYRQYHLQAGIAARQKTSNCRTNTRDN